VCRHSAGSVGRLFPMLKYFSNKIYGSSSIKLFWFENTKILIAVQEKKIIVPFIIIFGTLSFPADSAAERRCLHRASSVELAVLKARFLIDTDRAARREICMDSGSPPRRGRPPATDTGDLRDRTFAPRTSVPHSHSQTRR